MTAPIGWIVLTQQADGSWQDDWDGRVHFVRLEADRELDASIKVVGLDKSRLAELRWV